MEGFGARDILLKSLAQYEMRGWDSIGDFELDAVYKLSERDCLEEKKRNRTSDDMYLSAHNRTSRWESSESAVCRFSFVVLCRLIVKAVNIFVKPLSGSGLESWLVANPIVLLLYQLSTMTSTIVQIVQLIRPDDVFQYFFKLFLSDVVEARLQFCARPCQECSNVAAWTLLPDVCG